VIASTLEAIVNQYAIHVKLMQWLKREENENMTGKYCGSLELTEVDC